MATCLTGEGMVGRVANAEPQLPKVRPLKVEATRSVACEEAPGEAGAPLALGRPPASGSTVSACSVALFFSEAVGSPHWKGRGARGQALQDTKLGTGSREI